MEQPVSTKIDLLYSVLVPLGHCRVFWGFFQCSCREFAGRVQKKMATYIHIFISSTCKQKVKPNDSQIAVISCIWLLSRCRLKGRTSYKCFQLKTSFSKCFFLLLFSYRLNIYKNFLDCDKLYHPLGKVFIPICFLRGIEYACQSLG